MTEKSLWLITIGALFLLGLYEAPATHPFRWADQIAAPVEPEFSDKRNVGSTPKQGAATVRSSPCLKADL